MSVPNDLILYHYDFSPFSKRVVWYLTLRGIPYAQCLQPIMLPRPDLQALGVEYRRIPILAHGKSIFCDSRLIVDHLEAVFPSSNLAAESPEQEAIQKLLEAWAIDGGVFDRAAQSLPPTLPLMQDPKFIKDREQYTGRSWKPETVKILRPEGLVHLRNIFEFLESVLLSDGRTWILNTKSPKLADLEAVWLVVWLIDLKVVLPEDVISAARFPRVYAWVSRFKDVVGESKKQQQDIPKISGEEARAFIQQSAPFSGHNTTNGNVDELDPSGLRAGMLVESWPSDTGVANKDRGHLVGLSHKESILRNKEGVYVHHPRWNFKIRAVDRADQDMAKF